MPLGSITCKDTNVVVVYLMDFLYAVSHESNCSTEDLC